MSKHSKKFRIYSKVLFILLGFGIAVYLANKMDYKQILDNLKLLGWRTAPILMLPAVWYLCYTFAWDQFLTRLKGHISIWELFRAKIAGEAVNTVTPASFLGGDPVRVYILKKHFPTTESTASVVVDRTLHTMAVLVLISLGFVIGFWELEFLPNNMRYGLPFVLIISLIFMVFVFAHQRRGLFSFIMFMLKRLHIKKSFSRKAVENFQQLDYQIADFHLKAPGRFWTALSLHFVGRLLGVVEIYIVGKIVYPEFTWYAALLLCALAPLVNFIFAFIPGALGVLEGAYSGLLYILHMPPEVGLSIQLFRRLRSAFWIMLGFIALGTHDRKKLIRSAEATENS